jgi:hypothetical protein
VAKKKEPEEEKEEPVKAEEENKPKAEKTKSMGYLIPAIIILVLIAVAAVVVSMPPQPSEGGISDELVVQMALDASASAMDVAESKNNLSISRNGTVGASGSGYDVAFRVVGSEQYEGFHVVLDSGLNLLRLGFDDQLMDKENFINKQQGPNELQRCAKIFNEREVIPKWIQNLQVNTTSPHRYILSISKNLICNNKTYSYSVKIEDGRVTTTIDRYYLTSSFKEGIVAQGVEIPMEDIQKGVFLMADNVPPGKIAFSYELREEGALHFDGYKPQLAKDYNVTRIPTLVWNCKNARIGTLASVELNGSVAPGSERDQLTFLSCMFNAGEPKGLCESLGVVVGENGTIENIEGLVDPKMFFAMYKTFEEPCKPEGNRTLLEVFYSPDCTTCGAQRPILDGVEGLFGGQLEVKYWCVGDKQRCINLINV